MVTFTVLLGNGHLVNKMTGQPIQEVGEDSITYGS